MEIKLNVERKPETKVLSFKIDIGMEKEIAELSRQYDVTKSEVLRIIISEFLHKKPIKKDGAKNEKKP